MKRIFIALILVFCFTSSGIYASESSENFGAPVPPGGEKLISELSATVKLSYKELSFREIEDFYKNELKDKSDINWKGTGNISRIIHDWGNREWHKIKLEDRGSGRGVEITIIKDNWTWIIGTLVIRFVGVLIVLIILMIALYILGKLMSISVSKNKEAESES